MTSQLKNFKIISTIGPASLNIKFLNITTKYQQANFRINTSHLNIIQLKQYLNFLNNFYLNNSLKCYLDLPGKKMRIGYLDEEYYLENGEYLDFTLGKKAERFQIPIPHVEFFENIQINDLVLMQDAQIKLKVLDKSAKRLRTQIIQGAKLRSHAGITVDKKLISPKEDQTDINEVLKLAKLRNIDYLALSYVINPIEINDFRQKCAKISYYPKVIAKIEHPSALENLEQICKVADEIWYCRGDLGNYISPLELTEWQDNTIKISKKLKKPVLIAGQVFQYLTEHTLPTRTEVVHFIRIIQQGANGIVLSDETAIGKNSEKAAEAVFSLLEHSR